MKPIINPWIIYFSNMLENIGIVITIALVALVIETIIMIFFAVDSYEFNNGDTNKILSKIKKLIVAIVSCAVLLAVIPSQKTVYTMLVLDQITPNNIKLLGDTGKNVIDYVTDEIGDILDKDK